MMRCKRVVFVAVAGSLATASAVSAQVSQMAGVRTQVPFALGPFELTTAGTVDRIASPVGARTPFSFDATLALPVKSGGFWFGSALEGAPEIDSTPQRAQFRFGVWETLRGIRVSIGASSRSARLGGGVTTVRIPHEEVIRIDSAGMHRFDTLTSYTSEVRAVASRVAQWADVEGRVSWRRGRAGFEAVVGSRPGLRIPAVKTPAVNSADTLAGDSSAHLRGALWTRFGLSYAVSNHFSLAGAIGIDPARLALGVPGTRFASVSLKLNPWRTPKTELPVTRPTAFVVMPAGVGHYRITYAVPNAASVELSGDFDKWRPVSLTQTRTGVWETTLTIAPGTYHVNVRVNGDKWVAPSGLPQAKDDFNGTVGVLVVR